MRLAGITRVNPGTSSNELVGGAYGSDPAEHYFGADLSTNATAPKREQFAQYGVPSVFVKIATQVSSSGFTALTYPDDGTNAVLPTSPATNGGDTLKLAATVLQSQATGLDPTGMLVMIVDNAGGGTAAGEVRRIVSWNAGTQTATLKTPGGDATPMTHAWSSTVGGVPAAGDHYRLLVDARYANNVYLRSEFSLSTATLTGAIEYYDFPLTLGATEGVRASAIRSFDTENTIQCLGTNYGNNPVEAGYFHGPLYAVSSRGMIGIKYRLTAISAGSVSLWLAVA